MTVPSSADPLIGTTVSQYEIVAKLGGGGMGVVYKARDTKLGRPVALKFLPPQWSHDESAKQRFVREAQAASATNHRNICVIHNIDETPDGRLFIVMAFYEGETLKQRLERGPMPVVEAVEIASEIADGLAKAHAQGVIHRDVKPGNLMLTEDGVKILDFGLAKFADALQLTVPGSTIGTVAYMSPEQARGEEADGRSDVWALGIVMFEMLTGAVPFRGTYQEATFHAIKNEPLPPLTSARADIPEALERIVMRALDKDPDKRFQSAREPARDLKLLAGRTVPLDLRTEEVVRPHGAALPPLPRRRFTPRRIAISAAVVLAMVMGTYIWITRPVTRTRVAIVPVINRSGLAELDPFRLALTQTLVIDARGSTRVLIWPYERLLEAMRRYLTGTADISSREAVQAVLTASGAQLVIIPTLAYENNSWRARAELRDAATMTTLTVIDTEPVVSSLSKKVSFDLMAALAGRLNGYFAANGPRTLRWLDAVRRVTGRRPPAIASRFRDLDAAAAFERGANKFQQLEYAAARDGFEQATKADPQSPLAFAWLARTSQLLQQIDAAQEAAAQANRWLRPETPEEDVALISAVDAEARHDANTDLRYRQAVLSHPDDPAWLVELAAFQDRESRSADAIATYQRALGLEKSAPAIHVELCRLYGRTNEPAKARQEGELALTLTRASGNRTGEALALMCLTNVLRLGDPASQQEARRDAAAAVAILEKADAPYNLARAHYYVALAAESQGPAAAVPLYEKALTSARSSENTVLEPLVLMNLGALNGRLGKQSHALDYLQQGLHLFERFGDERRAAQLQSNIGSILIEYGGKTEEGLRDIQNSQGIFRKLGDRDFETYTARIIALADRYGGRLDAAESELNKAISLAKERDLRDRMQMLLIYLAQCRFERADYSAARNYLIEALADGTGENSALALVTLGRVHARLGDFTGARTSLDRAATYIQESGNAWLQPAILFASGEAASAAGRQREAKDFFARAAALWVDDLPEPASVEARALTGWLTASEGQTAAGRKTIETSLSQARTMKIYSLQVRCTILLARLAILEHREKDALDLLTAIPPDGSVAVGPEVQAQVHYWRARARNGGAADPDALAARQLLEGIRSGLPEADRRGFSSRADLPPVTLISAVQ